jgi:ABC-type multidrug transport system ATPase subunit
VLISSHVLAEVAQTVDRVLIISRGRLVLSSSLAELTARAGGAVRVRSADPRRPTTALRDEALQVTAGTDHALLVQGASSERIGEIAFAAGVPFTSWSTMQACWKTPSSNSPRRHRHDRADQGRAGARRMRAAQRPQGGAAARYRWGARAWRRPAGRLRLGRRL